MSAPVAPVALARMELMAGEEADAIVEAAQELTPHLVVTRRHGIVLVEAAGWLTFDCATVTEILGRPWDTRQLQVIMAAYAGNIVRMDEEGVLLSWGDAGPAGTDTGTIQQGDTAT